MTTLFSKGKKTGKGRYRELAQHESDSEASLSEEEKVVFKKPGAIELNLFPQAKIQQPKTKASCCQYAAVCVAIVLLLICITAVAVAYQRFHGHQAVLVNSSNSMGTSMVCKDGDGCWTVLFENTGSEGAVRLLDVDGDGKDDVIFSSSNGAANDVVMGEPDMKIFKGLHDACDKIGRKYPCFGKLTALRGFDGKQLWSIDTRSGIFVMNCEQFDINKDGKMDCIGTGRLAQIVAFDAYKGEVLWTCEDDKFVNASWNTYQAAKLPDWDGDGVPEVLLANGGDVTKSPEDHNRLPGRLLVLSGATGQPLGNRYLNVPHQKETYMSPIVYTPGEGKPTYILFGSGGETVPGDLLGISLRDFCQFLLGDTAHVCLKEKDTHYTNLTTDDNMKQIFVIYRGQNKGVMVPPVIADVNNDGTLDILMTTFEGRNVLYNGLDLSLIWTAEFSNMETYSTPSPGYFDDDHYVDFMIHWNSGEWMEYFNSTVYIISGKDGSILWSLLSNYMKMSSPLSILSTDRQHSSYLFSTIARESIFTWTKEGVVKHKSQTGRRKRHGEHQSSVPAAAELVELRKHDFEQNINCNDDLSTFAEEMFVLDSSSVKAPSRIMVVPTEKHVYDANPTCSVKHFSMHGGQVLPQSHDGSGKLPLSRNQESSLENGFQPPVSESENQPSASSSGNQLPVPGNVDQLYSGVNQKTTAGTDRILPGNTRNLSREGEHPDKISPLSDGAGTVQVKRDDSHLTKMCTVERPDGMSSGAVGDVDGDGMLDYISVLSPQMMMFDAEYCEQGMAARVIVRKISMEKGLLEGQFPHIPVKAKTTQQESLVGKENSKKKLFAPMSQQKWTHYMGAKGTNHLR